MDESVSSLSSIVGSFFGGCDKAVLVEDGAYLTRLIHHIHLKLVRTRMVKKGEGLELFEWRSLSDCIKPPRKRRSWVDAEKGLENTELRDTVAGRREFLKWTEDCVNWRKRECAEVWEEEEEGLQSTVRQGRYLGQDAFRERLLKVLAEFPAERSKSLGYVGQQTRDYGIAEAERLIGLACGVFGSEGGRWIEMKKVLKKGQPFREGGVSLLEYLLEYRIRLRRGATRWAIASPGRSA